MRCILDGHRPINRRGVGPYADMIFTICSECGKTLGQVKVEKDRRNEAKEPQ